MYIKLYYKSLHDFSKTLLEKNWGPHREYEQGRKFFLKKSLFELITNKSNY